MKFKNDVFPIVCPEMLEKFIGQRIALCGYVNVHQNIGKRDCYRIIDVKGGMLLLTAYRCRRDLTLGADSYDQACQVVTESEFKKLPEYARQNNAEYQLT